MAFAGPLRQLASGRPRPYTFALCYSCCRFRVGYCFARFCALAFGWAFRRSRGNRDFPVEIGICAYGNSPFSAYGKLLPFLLRCALLGVSRMKTFVGILARYCKNSRDLFLQFSGSENSSGLWAVARLRLTTYQPANRSAREGCLYSAC